MITSIHELYKSNAVAAGATLKFGDEIHTTMQRWLVAEGGSPKLHDSKNDLARKISVARGTAVKHGDSTVDIFRRLAGLSYNNSLHECLRTILATPAVPAVLLAPVMLAATPVNPVSFTVNWTPGVGSIPPDGYLVDIAFDENFLFIAAAWDGFDVGLVTSAEFIEGVPDTDYYVRVRAYTNGPGEVSGQSNVVIAEELHAPPEPVPISVTEFPTATSFELTWTSPPSFDGVVIDVTPVVNDWVFDETGVLYQFDAGAVEVFEVTGLAPGIEYAFRVSGYNNGGVGPGIPGTATTLVAAPAMPDTNSIVVTDSTIQVGWVDDPAASGWKVDLSIAADFSSFVGPYENLDLGPLNLALFAGLDPETLYYYRIRAYNDGGTSPSKSANATTEATP
jgi:hypothetical protein